MNRKRPDFRYPDLPPDTLMIGRTSSRCNNCGHDANPDEECHITRLGYDPGDGKGCGIRWQHVYSTYCGTLAENAVRAMRPDLTFIPIEFPEIQ